jgi:acyl-CoA hydrolase
MPAAAHATINTFTCRTPWQENLHPALKPFADKVVTPELAIGGILNGDHVFVGTGCAAPGTLLQTLEGMTSPPADIELLHFFTVKAFNHDEGGRCTTRFRHRTFFVGSDMRAASSRAWWTMCPCRLRGCRR